MARADDRCYQLFLLSRCKIPGQFDYHFVCMRKLYKSTLRVNLFI